MQFLTAHPGMYAEGLRNGEHGWELVVLWRCDAASGTVAPITTVDLQCMHDPTTELDPAVRTGKFAIFRDLPANANLIA